MKSRFCYGMLGAAVLFPAWLSAQKPEAGKNAFVIRSQRQDIYFYPAKAEAGRWQGTLFFAPGDGGWRGFAVTLADSLSAWRYEVYGLDTRRYLESFTGKTGLREADVMRDFRQMARWLAGDRERPVTLLGWSEGAGLCLLAAAAEENKKTFNGLITLGLPDTAFLGWKWSDFISQITKKDPMEPKFSTTEYLPKVTPLPFLLIQSSHDEYVSVATGRRLFSAAREPKRFAFIDARNHRFEGNQKEFFRVLHEGVAWINPTPR